jgi:hypothetical protein
MGIVTVIGTLALTLLIATAASCRFLSFRVYYVVISNTTADSTVGSWLGEDESSSDFNTTSNTTASNSPIRSFSGGDLSVSGGVYCPHDWISEWAFPNNDFGQYADPMKILSQVFLYQALALGVVAVGLIWSMVWRLWRLPDGATSILAGPWLATSLIAALCAMMCAPVFVLFFSNECNPFSFSSHTDDFTTAATSLGRCRMDMGSIFLLLSFFLWVVLTVVMVSWGAPIYSWNVSYDSVSVSVVDFDGEPPGTLPKGM